MDTHKQIKIQLAELIDAFKNLKEYCLYNQIGLYGKCDHLHKQAELIQTALEDQKDLDIKIIKERIQTLTEQYEKLKKDFVR